MTIGDINAIIRAYLVTQTALTALVGGATPRIYSPRLPEKATLPAVGFFARGGISTPYIPGIVTPSVQFDCWAETSIEARRVYRALYDALQGIQNVSAGTVVVQGTDGVDYQCILAHTGTADNKPVTGANFATYWTATGGSNIGAAWGNGIIYPTAYQIMSAIEEVQGQDLVDVEVPNYFRTLSFFEIMIRAE